uniref:lycopene beta-cyclase n=1 Tax=Chlamydomonas leiostraca TaxID=1034604 RepID=A0A7S0RHM7_9CHLO|mmetsp:Transcript_22831/g.58127  ORF Transcript_22831/g.58127 Transcript_22831/m.58127 type:complete len:560 (+) Transcript_22831:85-1764(+)
MLLTSKGLQALGTRQTGARVPARTCAPSVRRSARRSLLVPVQSTSFADSPVTSKPPINRHAYRDPSPWPTPQDTPIQIVDTPPEYVDLIVAGGGPSGIAVAQRVAAAGFSVVVIEQDPYAIWPNNYGVWVDEFQAMGLEDCLQVVWPKAKVWLHSGPDGERFLKRPFGRVDRPALKKKLLSQCAKAGVKFISTNVDGVSHANGCSTVRCKDGRTVTGSLVLDATGHARKLVKFDRKFDPGYQGAYGIICEVESHPFEIDTMLFMDWRDDHTEPFPVMRRENQALPTFLYAMPFSKTKIFVEETSLVARPAVGFKELKERLDARLKHMGIKVKKIEEEEYCLIPMGGVLPVHPQRVLGIGGTAGMVHPSTGFMMSRMLGAAPTVSDAIIDQLSRPADRATNSAVARKPRNEAEAEAMAAAIWRATWPVERIRQRAFNNFGMDMLLSLNLAQIRDFFNAFFSLSDFHWHGFLSTRLSFTELIGFGLSLFVSANNDARVNLLQQGVPGLFKMLYDVAPTVGEYYKDDPTVKQQKSAADVAAAAAKRAPVQSTQAKVPVSVGK